MRDVLTRCLLILIDVIGQMFIQMPIEFFQIFQTYLTGRSPFALQIVLEFTQIRHVTFHPPFRGHDLKESIDSEKGRGRDRDTLSFRWEHLTTRSERKVYWSEGLIPSLARNEANPRKSCGTGADGSSIHGRLFAVGGSAIVGRFWKWRILALRNEIFVDEILLSAWVSSVCRLKLNFQLWDVLEDD